MKQYYLHIGFHKTGSKFIQKNILEKISSEEYYIITPSSKINQTILDFLKTKNPELKKNIFEYLKKIEKKKIIYSSEALFGFSMNGFKDKELRFKILEEIFEKPKYIIFFREPSEIIYSHYFQGLRGLYLFEDFIEYSTKDLQFLHNELPQRFAQGTNYKLFDYNELLKDYIKIKDRVSFINFDDFFVENPEKSLIKFQTFLGLKLDLNLNYKEKTNPSQKKLIYFIFYNKYLHFKIIKIVILRFFLLLSNFKILKKYNFRHIIANTLQRVIIFYNYFFKLINSKKLNEYEKKIKQHKEFIKSYHLQNYKKFLAEIEISGINTNKLNN